MSSPPIPTPADLASYTVPADRFERALQPLADLDVRLKAMGPCLTVLLMPYEAQLRIEDPSYDLPQQRIVTYCRDMRIRCLDLRSAFAAAPRARDLFLPGDPMHLSREGHRVVFDALIRDLAPLEASLVARGPGASRR